MDSENLLTREFEKDDYESMHKKMKLSSQESDTKRKEIVRIIIDSASSCRLVQNDVTIPDENSDMASTSDLIDMTNTVNDNTCDWSSTESGNENDLPTGDADTQNDDPKAIEIPKIEEKETDHSYTSANENAEKSKPIVKIPGKKIIRIKKIIAVPKQKRDIQTESVRNVLQKSELPKTKSPDKSSYSGLTNAITTAVKNDTTSNANVLKSDELNWKTINKIMDNIAFVGDGKAIPKEIHVRISDNPENSNRALVENDVRTRVIEPEYGYKLVQCALCGHKSEDPESNLKHYEDEHDESYENLIAKASKAMSSKMKARKESFEKLGMSGLLLKMTPTGLHTESTEAEGDDSLYIACEICYFKFPRGVFNKHLFVVHYWNRIKQAERQKQENAETRAGKMAQSNKVDRPMVGPFVCDQCGKHHEQFEAFCAHMWRVHSDEKYRKMLVPEIRNYDKGAYCQACSKQFKNKHSLACHISEYHKKDRKIRVAKPSDKRYNCELCNYSTPEARRLKLHVNKIHMGINAYKCPFCTYTTNEQTALRHHKYTHTAEKPLSCGYCPFKCVQKHDIRSHLKRSHHVILQPVRSLKYYHTDPEHARTLRNAALEEQQRHFTTTINPLLHSCKGNEYYDVPFDDSSPNPADDPSYNQSYSFPVVSSDMMVDSSGFYISVNTSPNDHRPQSTLTAPDMPHASQGQAFVTADGTAVTTNNLDTVTRVTADANGTSGCLFEMRVDEFGQSYAIVSNIAQGSDGQILTENQKTDNRDSSIFHVEEAAPPPAYNSDVTNTSNDVINDRSVIESLQHGAQMLENVDLKNEIVSEIEQVINQNRANITISQQPLEPDEHNTATTSDSDSHPLIDSAGQLELQVITKSEPTNELNISHVFSADSDALTIPSTLTLDNAALQGEQNIGEQTFMVEMGTDELGNKRYAVISADQLNTLSQSCQLTQENVAQDEIVNFVDVSGPVNEDTNVTPSLELGISHGAIVDFT